MTLFKELEKKVCTGTNSNFYFDKLDWVAQVWITNLCELVEEKLKEKNYHHPLEDLDR